jgi:transcriptional regulator with GAF, ATPase, and Fis domain
MRLEVCSERAPQVSPPSQLCGPSDLVGDSEVLRQIRFQLEMVARTDATVLLLGETGTGKGVAAEFVHTSSLRRSARFVAVDCTALPATLIESELFGREKGAFTDARTTQIGRFELANGGTILLDEIGELPPDAQSKLLRVLQRGQFERLGSPRTVSVDVRVIAATNRNLVEEVRAGRFRRDLYYRLNVFPVTMPPLRAHRGDICALTRHLVERLARKHRKAISLIPGHLMASLESYDWPGNVRELENVLERAVITTLDGTLHLAEPLPAEALDPIAPGTTTILSDVERAHILRVLQVSAWRIEGTHGAAVALGLKPSTLRSRMRKLGIQRRPLERAHGLGALTSIATA